MLVWLANLNAIQRKMKQKTWILAPQTSAVKDRHRWGRLTRSGVSASRRLLETRAKNLDIGCRP